MHSHLAVFLQVFRRNLKRPALIETPPDIALHLKSGDVLVHRRQRSQIQCGSNLFVAWTVSLRIRESDQEIQELFLPSCERHCPLSNCWRTNEGKSTTNLTKNVPGLFVDPVRGRILGHGPSNLPIPD